MHFSNDSDESEVPSSTADFSSCKCAIVPSTKSRMLWSFSVVSSGLFSSVLGLLFISVSELYTPASKSFTSDFLTETDFFPGRITSTFSVSDFDV